MAEETGVIVTLGNWITRQAALACAQWPEDISVAVNLSPVQFRRPGLKDRVVELLDKYGLSGSRLELEVTESLLIEDTDSVCQTLSALKELGVGISMDDFGTEKAEDTKIQRQLKNTIKKCKVCGKVSTGSSLNIQQLAEGCKLLAHLAECGPA